jgi:hypothetical protein
MRHFALFTLAALALAACSTAGQGLDPQGRHGDVPRPDFDHADTIGGSCGAGEMGYLVGQQVEEVDLDTLARSVRPIYPDTAITEDYRPQRVNLDLTADGVILRVWCG